ncbi:hypothetical protein EDD92_8815 [Streptomyces sp. TLI_185]|nr:hypothetical protein EDD92_8815 [Streptomyces sp. TLI_185]
MRRRLVPAVVVLLTGCSTGPSLETQGEVTAPPGDSHRLTVGSAGFTESDLLAQMCALLLNQAGYETSLLTVANRKPPPTGGTGQRRWTGACRAGQAFTAPVRPGGTSPGRR